MATTGIRRLSENEWSSPRQPGQTSCRRSDDMSETNSKGKNPDDSGEVSNPDCEMPACVGSPDDDTKAVRDPSNNLVEICEGCLDDGWRGVVEVLE